MSLGIDRTRQGRAAIALLSVLVVVLAVGAVLVWRGLSVGRDSAEGEVERTIRTYNEILAWGYANLDMNRLTAVATTAQAEQEYYHMAALGEGGVRLVSVLDQADFEDLTIEGTSTARAVTRETWTYRQLSVFTSETIAASRVTYGLRWELEHDGTRWLVTGVSAFESREHAIPGSALPTNAVPYARPPGEPRGSLPTRSLP